MAIAVDQKKWGPEYVQGVAPTNPLKPGMTWFDTSTNELKIYNYVDTDDNILDLSSNGHIINRYGGVSTIRLGNEIVGPCSIQFDGSNDYLEIADSADWDIFAGDFTIDFWLNVNAFNNQAILGHYQDGNNYWLINIPDSSNIQFYIQASSSTVFNSGTIYLPSARRWYHVAFVRNSTNFYAYLNGAEIISTTCSNSNAFTGPLQIGTWAGVALLQGFLDEIRISKGIDRTGMSNDLLYIDGDYHGNSETVDVDNCNDISGWNDWDTGTGASTESAFDGTDSFKFTSGATAGAGNYAYRFRTAATTVPDKFSVSVKTYCDAVGQVGQGDEFRVDVQRSNCQFLFALASDGLWVYGSSGYAEVGTNLVVQDSWQEWEFAVDTSTPSSATCDVYLNGTLVASSVNCVNQGSYNDGQLSIFQKGSTTTNRISYIDYIKVGGWKEFALPNDHHTDDSYTKLLIQPEGGAYWHTLPNNPATARHGYYVGGNNGAYISTIERIEFPFDSGTATVVSPLSVSNGGHCGFNSSTYGYICGGYNGSYFSYIHKIAFPFDSGSDLSAGDLNNNKGFTAGCNSSRYGYIMGGVPVITSIERILFPFNSGTGSFSGNLAHTTFGAGGINSSIHGYATGGGQTTALQYTYIDRILFPFDSGTATTVGNINKSRGESAGCNSSTQGYVMGGYYWSGLTNVYVSQIDRIAFPFNSGIATIPGNLTYSRRYVNAGCNSSFHGYAMGGFNPSISIIDRISFPFDSGTASYLGSLSEAKGLGVGLDGVDFVTQFV